MSYKHYFISKEIIQENVSDIGKYLNIKHNTLLNPKDPILFIGVLNGAFMFFSDLVKSMSDNLKIECDFVSVKSYEGKEKKDLIIIKNIETSVEGKHVYIVDDIYDTGDTINFLYEKYKIQNPKSITAITLFKRYKSKNQIPSELELISSITISHDAWIYGYGMDDSKGFNRNLPYILVE